MAGSTAFLFQDTTGVYDITPYVRRFVYRNSLLTGFARWTLFITATEWGWWKDIMIGNGLRFSLKIKHVADEFSTETEWLNLVVDTSAGVFHKTQMQGKVVGGGIELNMMEKTRRRAFVDQPISSIFQRIASGYQLVPEIDTSTGIQNWYQANQSDWDFLQELFDYFLSSTSGRGDVFFNVDNQTLYVKSINFAKPAVRQYAFTMGRQNDMSVSAQYKYYGGQVSRKGGLVIEARGFDRDTGLSVIYKATPILNPAPVLKDKFPKETSMVCRAYSVPTSNYNLVRARALREQAKFGMRYYGISILVLNELTIKLRDMMEVSIKDTKGDGAPQEGRYGVFGYKIDVDAGNIKTAVTGYRRESTAGPEYAVGPNVSQVPGGVDRQPSKVGRDSIVLTATSLGD